MGIIDSKNLLTATENIKPKATKPYSKRRKNPFAKQFKLTDRNAPKDAPASESLTGILNAKPANKTVLTIKAVKRKASQQTAEMIKSLFLQTTSRIITITSRKRESRSTLLSLRRTKRKAAERHP